jgi:hypothetical protein
MPPIPPEQCSPYGSEADPKLASPFPHLTTRELAARLRCTRETISRSYRRWGLRPIRIAGSLLWPITQIEDLERRAMSGELMTEK